MYYFLPQLHSPPGGFVAERQTEDGSHLNWNLKYTYNAIFANIATMSGYSNIEEYQMGVLGDDDHRKMAEVVVTSPEMFSNSLPVAGGVYDLRMGTTDHHYRCPVCKFEKSGGESCNTHPGVLETHTFLPSAAFIAEIRRWLRSTCQNCGNAREDPDLYAGTPRKKRLAEASLALTDGMRCKTCGVTFPKIKKDEEDHFSFYTEVTQRDKTVVTKPLHWAEIRSWFERIPDHVAIALGRDLDVVPRKLVLGAICVPPNGIRPSVKSFGSVNANSNHDITNLLQHIVKRSLSMPSQIPAEPDEELSRSLRMMAQLYYDMILGSASTSAAQGSGGKRGIVMGARAVPAILRRHPRKHGRLRENLQGMRVFHISRSTISGNSSLRADQVGMPISFARKLQLELVVQEFNFKEAMRYFRNGRAGIYPGCSRIIKRGTGDTYEVKNLAADFQLEIGDKMLHDVVSGSTAFFNRQPTLNPSSISAMNIIVIEDPNVHTFQMNVLACSLFNADFDGDAMNLWMHINATVRAEAKYMSPMVGQFISPKSSTPVGGQVQDSVVGVSKLTRGHVKLDKWHAMALFATTGLEPPNFSTKGSPAKGASSDYYSGHDVVSMLYSAHAPINYSRGPSFYNEAYAAFYPYSKTDTLTVMEHGVLKQGVLDKKSVGEGQAGGINHIISREYGPQKSIDLIFALQQIAIKFLTYTGFSIGMADLVMTPAAMGAFRTAISGVLAEADLVTRKLSNGEIIPPIDTTTHDYYERLMRNALRPNDSELLRHIVGAMRLGTNGMLNMTLPGAKGSTANVIAIIACIGQITINGERIQEQFGFRRTSPYHPRFAVDPAAYGFVSNSYMSGMTSSEFIFNSMNGRFDLITKALSTSITGYFMRKGIMSNQSTIIDNLRRAMKDSRVVQLLYGEDGLDARQLEKVSFRTMAMSNAEVAAFLGAEAGDPVTAPTLARVLEDRDTFRAVYGRIEKANFRRTMSSEIWLAVNARRIAEAALLAARGARIPDEPLADKIALIEDLCARFPYLLINEIQERRRTPVPAHISAAVALQVMVVRLELNPRVLRGLSLAAVGGLVMQIRTRYSLSLIAYGTAVGILACSAVSEPLTQYMLDSHHRSVSGGTNKAGIQRVAEIYGARPPEEEQSATMMLPVLPQYATPEFVREIANSIEYMRLRDLASSHDVMFESYAEVRDAGPRSYPPFRGDAVWIKEFESSHPLMRPPPDLTAWCVRTIINKKTLVLKSQSIENTISLLRATWPNMYIVHTPESAREIIIRAFIRTPSYRRGAETKAATIGLADEFLSTRVRGIAGITTATPEQITRSVVDPATGALTRTLTWAISTVGTNLTDVMLNRYLDTTACISSSVGDTVKVKGILAGRNKIVTETRGFMEDNTPNLRHLFIYADEMTRLGVPVSIERTGLAKREPNNILLRMAASAPIQVEVEAAVTAARGNVYGVAGPLNLGAMPKVGTLYNEALIDTEYVKKNTVSVESVLDSL